MKKLTLFIPLVLLLTTANAQYGICLEYDNAGNRIFRHDCVSMLVGGEEQRSFWKASEHPTVVPGEVLAFPNPTDGKFQLRTGMDFPPETSVSVYDELGKLLTKRQLTDGHFDLSGYPAGTYYLHIINGSLEKTLSVLKSDR